MLHAFVAPGLELFAAGIEMQHLFMLVHDDVMDQATRRRGEPPVHVAVRQVRDRERACVLV